jgi:protein-S-isoprenylcysteine O-methyltransferase Ste14
MIDPLRLLLFVVLSAAAVAASHHAWRTRQAYGFFRFFGFETLAVLVAWNAGRWFREPFSILQIISWTLFAVSIALAARGIYLLRAVGGAHRRIMEDTQTLVEVGLYRYIRHPLYASLIVLGWGVFFKGVDLPSGVLASAATAFFVATARYEEGFNIESFGAVYAEYMKRTKMFIPFLL